MFETLADHQHYMQAATRLTPLLFPDKPDRNTWSPLHYEGGHQRRGASMNFVTVKIYDWLLERGPQTAFFSIFIYFHFLPFPSSPSPRAAPGSTYSPFLLGRKSDPRAAKSPGVKNTR